MFLLNTHESHYVLCRVSDPFTEIPANMLLFQICIPFAVEHFKLKATIKSLLHYWFTAVGWALGLTDYLLPSPEDDNERENGQPGGQDRAVVEYMVPEDLNRVRQEAADANLAEEADGDEPNSEYVVVFGYNLQKCECQNMNCMCIKYLYRAKFTFPTVMFYVILFFLYY